MISVEIEGRGQVAEFPDETDQAVIDATIKRDFFPEQNLGPLQRLGRGIKDVATAFAPLFKPLDMTVQGPPLAKVGEPVASIEGEVTQPVQPVVQPEPVTPVISSLKEQPQPFYKQTLPEMLGMVPVKPKKILGELKPEDKVKASNIIAMSQELELPPSFVDQNYDAITQKLGMRGVPTRNEMVQMFVAAAIGQGFITAPIATLMGVGTYMGAKETESLATQVIKGEKPKLLQGRELMEFLGQLGEPQKSIAEALEFAAPGFLGAKIMSKVKGKLSEKLAKKLIDEAWDDYVQKQSKNLLEYKARIERAPVEEVPPIEPAKPIEPVVRPPEPIKAEKLVKPEEISKPEVIKALEEITEREKAAFKAEGRLMPEEVLREKARANEFGDLIPESAKLPEGKPTEEEIRQIVGQVWPLPEQVKPKGLEVRKEEIKKGKYIEAKVEVLKPTDPELTGTIQELSNIIKSGQPGGKTFTSTRTENLIVGGYGSSQAVEKVVGMEGVSREEALRAIDKGLRGEKLGLGQQRIWDSISKNAKQIIEDRKAQEELDVARAEIAKADLAKEETRNALTKHIDDEIMGLKEQLYEEGYSDTEVSGAIEEVTKGITVEVPPADIEGIEREIRSLITPKVETEEYPYPQRIWTEPTLSPTAKDQFALPGKSAIIEPVIGKKGKGTPTVETPKPEGGEILKMSHDEFKKYLYDQAVETRMEPTAPGQRPQAFHYLRAKIGDEGTFFRKGQLPKGGQSYNYAEGRYESGVSVYPSPEATSLAGLSEGNWFYGHGKIVDIGSDFEPIIKPIGEWKKIGKNEYEAVENYRKILKKESLPNLTPPAGAAGAVSTEPSTLPQLSPTEKNQYNLPGIKQGLEMKGAKEGVTPTLEGTPLGEAAKEAARKTEIEKEPTLFTSEAGAIALDLLAPGAQKVIAATKEVIEAYKRPPEITESKKIIGKYTGALQEIDLELSKLGKEINEKLPKDRQEAITNYMQAGGEESLLTERLQKSNLKHKKGYRDALGLTPEEKQWADTIRKRLDDVWQLAYDADVIESYVENYVRGEWVRPEQAGKKLMAQAYSGLMRTKPREALRKVFHDYYEGEQAGFEPKDKRIGYQLVTAERSLRQAVEAKKALKALMESTEEDGRPTVAVGGSGSYIPKEKLDTKEAYFIKPNTKGKDTRDYRSIDHPSLRKWKWVDSDPDGKPIMLEGNMWIHPDAYKQMNALLGKSKISTYTLPEKVPILGGKQLGRMALEAGGFIKGTILIGPFHQFHVAEHAVFHRVSPFGLPPIDFEKRPLLKELVEHGLQLVSHNALAEFGEGLASGGLLHRIPILGDYLKKYQEWLFQDYIPRLKATMAEHAVDRAKDYYKEDLASGKFTWDQLLENVGKQANAAFGEQNYKYLGRDPTLQDALRIVLLAPDFLEARLKFAGQAARPYGREQLTALILGAMIMGVTAQVLNIMFSDDHKPHWTRPFTIRIGKREYTPRSVVGDIMHLITDPRSFWYHRLNPLWGRPLLEVSTGRDLQGRKVGVIDSVKDILKSWVPIPMQGIFKDNMGESIYDSTINALLQSVGMSNYPYKSDFERYAIEILGEKWKGISKEQKEKSKFKRGLAENIREKKPEAVKDVLNAVKEKTITLQQAMEIRRRAREDPALSLGKMLTVPELLGGWNKANDAEKKILKPLIVKKYFTWRAPLKEKMEVQAKVKEVRRWKGLQGLGSQEFKKAISE